MSNYARALVVDDLGPTREWLSQALYAAFPGIAVDTASNLREAMVRIEPPPPLALIDLGLPDGSGVQLIEALQARGAQTLCIVATVFDDDAHLFPALRAGAQGYVLKDQARDTLADMLRGIAAGQPPLSPSIARRLLRHFQPMASAPQAPSPEPLQLTPRETDVLRLTAKGLTVNEVAASLALSRHTVSGYLKEIYRKLSVSSRAEAALEAARRGLVTP
ncbi:MAG: response regulator transcription factor [Chiayiivirga sp.]|jgi:DNA-binding NarL/FixJ family response regulator|uniref:LuxR C-terminal-related transcriptional regulator n=1 Tax=Chiayiivirga sp. TaxID=2041042 RepID=UPI0025C5D565|nr:response regulator transcription factor [Chiayiivirga sp.]MCI1711915.1 response regulator transcription factor [Chiayiivirga sp.]MCI1729498.1 response regulator transcription factor [Chiayiivirga sp.]